MRFPGINVEVMPLSRAVRPASAAMIPPRRPSTWKCDGDFNIVVVSPVGCWDSKIVGGLEGAGRKKLHKSALKPLK